MSEVGPEPTQCSLEQADAEEEWSRLSESN